MSLADPALREDLDDLAKRAADVFDVDTAAVLAIEAQHELVIGASHDLPGARTSDGRDLILLPHGAPIAAQLLDDGTPWMVPDIERLTGEEPAPISTMPPEVPSARTGQKVPD